MRLEQREWPVIVVFATVGAHLADSSEVLMVHAVARQVHQPSSYALLMEGQTTSLASVPLALCFSRACARFSTCLASGHSGKSSILRANIGSEVMYRESDPTGLTMIGPRRA
jgi:hypothetical protein